MKIFFDFHTFVKKNDMPFFVESHLGDIFSGSSIRNFLGIAPRNNQYIYQPNFSLQPLDLGKQEQWQTVTGNEREVYLTTAELRIVVDRLATMYSNGIWKEYDKNGNLVEDSDAVKLLEQPNVFQSRNEYLMQWFIQRCLYANVYVYELKGMDIQEIPSALWNLSPSRMSIRRTGKIWQQTELNQIIEGYKFQMDDGKTWAEFDTNEIIQFSIPNPDDPIMGVSPLNSIRMAISNIRAAYGYRNVVLTRKGAIGIWSTEGKDQIGTISLTPEEKEEMSKQLTETYGIGDRQASVMIANKPMKWSPAIYPTKDMELFKEVSEDFKAIIDVYGANEYMFTSGENSKGSTFTNVEMGERACYQNTIIPIASDFAYGLAQRFGILDRGGRLELSYDHLPVMQEDQTKKAEVLEKKANAAQVLLSNGYQPNEINEIMQWELRGGSAPAENQ